MKKLIILTISMLMVSQALKADSHDQGLDQARAQVQGAHERIGQQHERREALLAEIERHKRELSKIHGKPEYREDFESRQSRIRELSDQYNNTVDECKNCIKDYGNALHEVSGRYHVTSDNFSGDNGSVNVARPTYRKPAPIVHKAGANHYNNLIHAQQNRSR